MNKLKTLIGIGLGAMLMTGVLVGVNVGHFSAFNLTRAQTPYICAGNVRLEPNEDGSYNITHIGAGATTVDLSTLLEQYDVVTINADAFDDCRDSLTSITIDANIPIEDGTFNNMAKELDVTFTGDVTELDYGHIFQNTTIGTMTIPESVTYVNPEMFYCVTDTTTLIYEGSFNNFWGSNGSDGIFGSLWTAYTNTSNVQTGSMPTNIKVNGKTYSATSLSGETIKYYNGWKNAFGHTNKGYYKTDRNL